MFKKAAVAVLKSTDEIPFALIILSAIAVAMLAVATFTTHPPIGAGSFTESVSSVFGLS